MNIEAVIADKNTNAISIFEVSYGIPTNSVSNPDEQ